MILPNQTPIRRGVRYAAWCGEIQGTVVASRERGSKDETKTMKGRNRESKGVVARVVAEKRGTAF